MTSSTPAGSAPEPSRSRKAAMIVQLMLRDGADLPLADLPESAQARLTKELGALSLIDKRTLESVLAEFSRDLSQVALTAPGSIEAALKSLDGRISPAAIARLREEAAAEGGHDPWASVLALELKDMLPITEAESPEISAILLSKLPTDRAAALLGLMPGERARRISYAMSKTTGVRPDAIARIGEGLSQAYCGGSMPAFSTPAEARIGAILNSSAPSTRDSVLEGLMSDDPTFGEGVRKAIFTFEDILTRLAPLDVPKVLREVENEDLISGLTFAKQAGGVAEQVVTFILENMSTRMADNLREEMAEAGTIKPSVGEAAQTALVSAIRTAADAGDIKLISEDDD